MKALTAAALSTLFVSGMAMAQAPTAPATTTAPATASAPAADGMHDSKSATAPEASKDAKAHGKKHGKKK